MESIMHLAYAEAMLFKHGSGTGSDLSPIRSSKEKLSGGGKPSGPLLPQVYDQVQRREVGEKARHAAR
jgi:ribonucleoside-diphosphate reductase alpha chain